MVEHRTFNLMVIGSSPIIPRKRSQVYNRHYPKEMIDLWPLAICRRPSFIERCCVMCNHDRSIVEGYIESFAFFYTDHKNRACTIEFFVLCRFLLSYVTTIKVNYILQTSSGCNFILYFFNVL